MGAHRARRQAVNHQNPFNRSISRIGKMNHPGALTFIENKKLMLDFGQRRKLWRRTDWRPNGRGTREFRFRLDSRCIAFYTCERAAWSQAPL